MVMRYGVSAGPGLSTLHRPSAQEREGQLAPVGGVTRAVTVAGPAGHKGGAEREWGLAV